MHSQPPADAAPTILRVVLCTRQSLLAACAQISANRTNLSEYTCGVLVCADHRMCGLSGRHKNRVQSFVTAHLCSGFCDAMLLGPFYKALGVPSPPTALQVASGDISALHAWCEECYKCLERDGAIETTWRRRATYAAQKQVRVEVDVVLCDPEFTVDVDGESLALMALGGWLADRMQEIVAAKVKTSEQMQTFVTVSSFGHGLMRGVDGSEVAEQKPDLLSGGAAGQAAGAEPKSYTLWMGKAAVTGDGVAMCTRESEKQCERLLIYGQARETFGGLDTCYEHIGKAVHLYSRMLREAVALLGADFHKAEQGAVRQALVGALTALRPGACEALYFLLPEFLHPSALREWVQRASRVCVCKAQPPAIFENCFDCYSGVLYSVCGGAEKSIMRQRSLLSSVDSILRFELNSDESQCCGVDDKTDMAAVVEATEWFISKDREAELAAALQRHGPVEVSKKIRASNMMQAMRASGELLSRDSTVGQVAAYAKQEVSVLRIDAERQ